MKWMHKEAVFLLLAFIPPALLTSLNAMNIFPFMARYDHFIMAMMQYNQSIGLSLQAVLFSLAIGNKYNRIHAENQQAVAEQARLIRPDKEKTEFFMNVSHELRTPLTIILGLSKQLADGSFGDSIRQNKSQFKTIERNGLKLMKQIKHMLRIGRLPGDTRQKVVLEKQLKH